MQLIILNHIIIPIIIIVNTITVKSHAHARTCAHARTLARDSEKPIFIAIACYYDEISVIIIIIIIVTVFPDIFVATITSLCHVYEVYRCYDAVSAVPISLIQGNGTKGGSGARNSGRVPSGYSTDSKDSGDSSDKKSDGPIIELTQQVKPKYSKLV